MARIGIIAAAAIALVAASSTTPANAGGSQLGAARLGGFVAGAIIPHTAAVTTLGTKRPGDLVNIEVDVLAKYVERLLAYDTQLPRGGVHQGVNS